MKKRRNGRRQAAPLKLASFAFAVFMTAAGACIMQAAAQTKAEAEPLSGPVTAVQVPFTMPELTAYGEDYENEKIEEALTAQGYLRDDIPLDKDLQAGLHAAADEAGIPFELAVAVVWQETDFRNIEGDGGDSIGFMQVQPRWHAERMERLGVDDLANPYQNFRVGCDYLAELIEKYGDTEMGLIGYNAGETKARQLFRQGVTSTEYSREVLAHYESLTEGVN